LFVNGRYKYFAPDGAKAVRSAYGLLCCPPAMHAVLTDRLSRPGFRIPFALRALHIGGAFAVVFPAARLYLLLQPRPSGHL